MREINTVRVLRDYVTHPRYHPTRPVGATGNCEGQRQAACPRHRRCRVIDVTYRAQDQDRDPDRELPLAVRYEQQPVGSNSGQKARDILQHIEGLAIIELQTDTAYQRCNEPAAEQCQFTWAATNK